MNIFGKLFGRQNPDEPVKKVPCSACGALILPATAKSTGGICMRCNREGPPVQSEWMKRAYATPARCLSPFEAKTTGDAIPAGSPRDRVVRFQLQCKCGSAAFVVLGFPMTSPGYPATDIFAAPISLSCRICGKTEQVFTPARDGHDGEAECSAGVLGSGEPAEFPCPKCSGTAHSVAVSLEYSIGDEEMEDEEEFAARPQDFFTGFSLNARCTKCRHLADVTDYECA